MGSKLCNGCGLEIPLTGFYRDSSSKDGRYSRCKLCVDMARAQWDRENPEKLLERKRQYYKTHRAELKEHSRLYRKIHSVDINESARAKRQAHPELSRAYLAVQHAIKRGVLERRPCEICGTLDNIEAHHDDYSKPLEVRWLCRAHHARLHAYRRLEIKEGR